MQPGGDGRFGPEAVGGPEGGDEGVLDGVGRFLGIAQCAQRHRPHPVPVTGHQLAERLRVAGGVRGQQFGVAPSGIQGLHAASLSARPGDPAEQRVRHQLPETEISLRWDWNRDPVGAICTTKITRNCDFGAFVSGMVAVPGALFVPGGMLPRPNAVVCS